MWLRNLLARTGGRRRRCRPPGTLPGLCLWSLRPRWCSRPASFRALAKMHALGVPIVKGGEATKMEEGEFFAIETFGSTGEGGR